jgi:hypothetical protein
VYSFSSDNILIMKVVKNIIEIVPQGLFLKDTGTQIYLSYCGHFIFLVLSFGRRRVAVQFSCETLIYKASRPIYNEFLGVT